MVASLQKKQVYIHNKYRRPFLYVFHHNDRRIKIRKNAKGTLMAHFQINTLFSYIN